jgi:hypothetical protein
MEVTQVQKKLRMSREGIIRFQLLVYCHLNKIPMSEAEIECLTLLGIEGESGLAEFCSSISDRQIFKTPQTVRNTIAKAEEHGLILKQGKSKKRIKINPDTKIQMKGNILLDFKFASIEP